MPTGYTAKIAEGIGFDDFVLNCARAFGALITMRDDPASTPIPERFEPSDHSEKKLVELKAALAGLQSMSLDDAEIAAHRDHVEELKSHQKRLREKDDLRKKYLAMLGHAKAWEPPSPDHVGLKEFMVEQITKSIEFDCSTEYMDHPVRLTGKQWLLVKTTETETDIAYHEKEHREEVARTEARNLWVQQLRDSLARKDSPTTPNK